MNTTPWYTDHANLAALAESMYDEGDTVRDILYMLQKPWKFDAEFAAIEKAAKA